jgi:hypothetical protein
LIALGQIGRQRRSARRVTLMASCQAVASDARDLLRREDGWLLQEGAAETLERTLDPTAIGKGAAVRSSDRLAGEVVGVGLDAESNDGSVAFV